MSSSETLHTRVLLTKRQISRRKVELVNQLKAKLNGDEFLTLGVMTGAIMQMTDLVRIMGRRGMRPQMDTMFVSSYGSKTESNKKPTVELSQKVALEGKHLVIIEDVLDTLYTIQAIVEVLRQYNPASISIIALIAKEGAAEVPMPEGLREILIGFEIPGHFWVHGDGIDTGEMFRWLEHIEVVLKGVTDDEVDAYLDTQFGVSFWRRVKKIWRKLKRP